MSETVELDWRDPPDLKLSPILRAALDVFYEKGYHGASVRELASRVGVTVPALYYHHENKEAILFSLLDGAIQRLVELCLAARAEAGPDPQTQFLFLVECTARFMARSGKVAFLDAEMRSLSPHLRAVYSAKRDRVEAMLLASVTGGVRAGVFDVSSPRDTARALLGMIQAIATWYRPDGRLSVDRVAARYLDIAAHTVGASASVLDRVRNSDRRPARRS